MGIIHRVKTILDPFRDDREARYAFRHLQESKLAMHGDVSLEHYRKGELIYSGYQGKNTFTTEGMAHICNVLWYETTQPTQTYVGIFKNNVTPAVGDTAALKLGAGGSYGECQDADYDSPATNRPSYIVASSATAGCTNAASKAEFTMAASITVYGAFLVTSQAKTATTGVLWCAKAFSVARAVVDNDELAVTYVLSLTTS